MNDADLPDGVPDEGEFDPQIENPHGVPPNHAGAMQIQVGLDRANGLVILRIGAGDKMVGTGIPIAGALQLAHNILGKCCDALMGPPPSSGGEEPQGGIIIPGEGGF